METVDENLFFLCVKQGYVPYDCQLNGLMILGLVHSGKNPCVGCKANCPHTVVESEYTQQYQQYKKNLKTMQKDMRIANRMKKNHIKTIMNIDCEYTDITLSIICLDSEKMYTKKFYDIEEVTAKILPICSAYHVEQILIDTSGFGFHLYEKIKNLPNVDIVPLKWHPLNV